MKNAIGNLIGAVLNLYVSLGSILIVTLLYSGFMHKGFSDSSVGKESTCNAGDSGSILGLGRSPEEEIGYPLQYSQASLVAQTVKNPPAMQETCVRFLG